MTTVPGPYDHLPPPPTPETQQAWKDSQQALIGNLEVQAERADSRADQYEFYGRMGEFVTNVVAAKAAQFEARTPREQADAVEQLNEAFNTPRIPAASRRQRRYEQRVDRKIDKFMEARQQQTGFNSRMPTQTYGIRPASREWARKREVRAQYRRNEITNREKNEAIHYIHATRGSSLASARHDSVAVPGKDQRRSARKTMGRVVGAQRAVRQPIASRWRAFRQNRAINRAESLQDRADEARRILDSMA